MSRILIVEDEARITSFLEKGLKANGFVTSVAGDAREGLAQARIGGYDLRMSLIKQSEGSPGRADVHSLPEAVQNQNLSIEERIQNSRDAYHPTFLVSTWQSGAICSSRCRCAGKSLH